MNCHYAKADHELRELLKEMERPVSGDLDDISDFNSIIVDVWICRLLDIKTHMVLGAAKDNAGNEGC